MLFRSRDPQLVLSPCLIIEVLSPSTEAHDRGLKFSQYRQLPSLQEYVLVQTEQPIVEVFQRHQDQKWLFAEYGMGQRFLLQSLNLEVLVDDLYRRRCSLGKYQMCQFKELKVYTYFILL